MGDLVCPTCSEFLDLKRDRSCKGCGDPFRVKRRIPSFSPVENDEASILTESELANFADRAEAHSVQAALDRIGDEKKRRIVSNEIGASSRDSWSILATDYLNGTCLDLHAGFGRRPLQLARTVEMLYAVDPNLHKLRVLTARDDFEDVASLVPIHATIETLPFNRGVFDTVILEHYNRSIDDLVAKLRTVKKYMTANSTVIIFLAGCVGFGKYVDDVLAGKRPAVSGQIPTSFRKYKRKLQSAGFTDITTLSFFPSYSAASYAFEGETVQNYYRVVESELSGVRNTVAKWTARMFDRTSILPELAPVSCVLAQYAPTGGTQRDVPKSRLLVSGRARTVALDYSKGELQRIYKVPNKRDYSSININETEILSFLRQNEGGVTSTLPNGEIISSEFGVIRCEEPIRGQSLSNYLSNSFRSFKSCLLLGLEWLITFQLTYKSDSYEKPPEKIRAEISRYGSSKSVRKPLTTFDVPVHGDLVPKNVFVDEDRIAGVIDWEYGRLDANPIIDSGYFILRVGKELFDRFENAFERLFIDENRYSEFVSDCIEYYCESLEIDREAFYYYLPLAFAHRSELEAEHDIDIGEKAFRKRTTRIRAIDKYEVSDFRAI